MTLEVGTRLGPYEIVAPLGTGGMGEVYRARDIRLNRDVAVKVLPDLFATDAERLARFEREAQMLAALNHPNIAAIHGLEESGGLKALILELVEGPTLADRITQGPIPLDDVFPIARQIADALEAAHAQGIVHRDLKPSNVKLRPDGTVKVLDFGLAKALADDAASGSPAMSPTLTAAATRMGVILGTAAYMSPEQARGKAVDKRADIWAFGCVLYEMLTGTRAFAGDEVSDTLAFVITKEPDWSALPATTPGPIRKLLRRCLEKDRKKRLADIADARFEIDEALTAPSDVMHAGSDVGSAGLKTRPTYDAGVRLKPDATGVEAASLKARPPLRVMPVIATAVIAAVVASGAMWILTRSAPVPRPVIRLQATPPASDPLIVDQFVPSLVFSPDGTRIVYVAGRQPRLYVRALDRIEGTPLSAAGEVRGPFFSPDGEWVAYFQGAELKKISIRGGPPVTICQSCAAGNRGGSWGPDDTIIFTSGNGGTGLLRVSAAGGEPKAITTPNRQKGETGHRWPELLPGGQAVLFTIASAGAIDTAQIAVLDLKTGTQKLLVRGGSQPHYVSTGHLVYGIGGTLRAVAFDRDRLEVSGNPVPVLEHVITKNFGAADFSVSGNGSLAYVSGDVRDAEGTLAWVDRQGKEEPVTAPPRNYLYVRLSPDGRRVALDVRDQENDIWVWDFSRRTLTRLTFDPASDINPVWSPDGRRIAYRAAASVSWQPADGTGAVESVTKGPNPQFPASFTPDGKALAILDLNPKTGFDVSMVSMNGDRAAKPLLHTPFAETNAEISPDGRWIAYQSNESGRDEIFVRPFPAVDAGRWQISTGGGVQPVWAHSGRELFYRDPDGRLMAVPIQAGASFAAGNPVVIIERRYAGSPLPGRTYDVSPDGKRFLMIKDAQTTEKSTPTQLNVVLNWGEELKRLAPAKR